MKSLNKQKSLLLNSFVLFLGKFSTQFISFLLLPIYTRYFNTSDYGIVDLVTTYIVLLVPVLTIQVEMYVFRFLIDNRSNEEQKVKIISNSLFLALTLTLFFCILYVIVCCFIEIKYSYYLAFMFISTIISNIFLQTSRGMGRNIDYSITCAICGVSNIILNVIFIILFKCGIESVFISSIISNAIGSIYLFFRIKLYSYISFRVIAKEKIFEIVSYSLPLVPNGIVWWVIDTSDRTIVTLILGLTANGIYSISNKFSHIINSFYNIFNMSWTESVSLYLEDEDDFLETTFNSIFKILCSLCLVLLSSMFLLFKIFISSDFSLAYNYTFILVIASIFSMLSSNLSAIYIAAKKTKRISITTIFSAVCNLIIHLILINSLKLYAAAYSTLIAFFLLFLIRYIDVQNIVKLRIEKKYSILFIILFAISYFSYISEYLIVKFIWMIISILIAIIVNKGIIVSIIHKLKGIKNERKVKE